MVGLDIPGNASDNLVTRAHRLLADKHDLPGLSIHLHKILPMGAGLGGGSADGTHALRAINEVCGLGLSKQELAKDAAAFRERLSLLFARRRGPSFKAAASASPPSTCLKRSTVVTWWSPILDSHRHGRGVFRTLRSPASAEHGLAGPCRTSPLINGICMCETTSKLALGAAQRRG